MFACMMTSFQVILSGILQLCTVLKLFKTGRKSIEKAMATTKQMHTSMPTTAITAVGTKTTGAATKREMTKIKGRVEYKMVLNSMILFILMSFIAITFFLFSFGIGFNWPLSAYFIHTYICDLFTLINPLLLYALSGTVRSMLWKFIHCRLYSLYD